MAIEQESLMLSDTSPEEIIAGTPFKKATIRLPDDGAEAAYVALGPDNAVKIIDRLKARGWTFVRCS